MKGKTSRNPLGEGLLRGLPRLIQIQSHALLPRRAHLRLWCYQRRLRYITALALHLAALAAVPRAALRALRFWRQRLLSGLHCRCVLRFWKQGLLSGLRHYFGVARRETPAKARGQHTSDMRYTVASDPTLTRTQAARQHVGEWGIPKIWPILEKATAQSSNLRSSTEASVGLADHAGL